MTISHYRESKQLAIISANAKAKSFSDYFHGIQVDECQTMTRGGNAISSIGIARRHWMPTVLFLRQQRKSVTNSATELFLKSSRVIATSRTTILPIDELIKPIISIYFIDSLYTERKLSLDKHFSVRNSSFVVPLIRFF